MKFRLTPVIRAPHKSLNKLYLIIILSNILCKNCGCLHLLSLKNEKKSRRCTIKLYKPHTHISQYVSASKYLSHRATARLPSFYNLTEVSVRLLYVCTRILCDRLYCNLVNGSFLWCSTNAQLNYVYSRRTLAPVKYLGMFKLR